MKESITKFDLEAAFKALDDIETPTAGKVKANRPALNEIFSRKSKFDVLFEEYYDITNEEDLASAKSAREAEVAQAKLARIEKIVDLDAESPDDLLPSYVGKFIIQCPQCMTLFYKNPEDVETSEEDPSIVNVAEVCQHCGNESGYNLIGKVGEAAPEETSEQPDEELDLEIENDEKDADAEAADDSAEVDAEDLGDLAELSEPDDSEETDVDGHTDESFLAHNGTPLNETLTEGADDVDVSPEEFEQLINSSEFKKPVSKTAVETMLNTDDAVVDEAVDSADNTVLTEELLTAENLENTEDTVTDSEDVNTEIEEGIFDNLKGTLRNKINIAGEKLKNTATATLDKVADTLKFREEKGDWILTAAIKPDGQKLYELFVVVCYDNKYNDGKEIKIAPPVASQLLVEKETATKTNYKDADAFAKGWSMRQDGGPAHIYLAKNEADPDKVFVCQYFEGKLEQDKLEELFKKVKDDLAGRQLQDKSNYNMVPANKVKPGDTVTTKKGDAKVTAINDSDLDDGISLTVQYSDGTSKTFDTAKDMKLKVLKETLDTIFSDIDDLHEASLENMISNSLIESYGNVAGFRLKECTYEDSKLILEGIIHFTSGRTRKTVYTFAEGFTCDNKITFNGLNEKLGLDKQFILTGRTDSRTFITESFNTSNT